MEIIKIRQLLPRLMATLLMATQLTLAAPLAARADIEQKT